MQGEEPATLLPESRFDDDDDAAGGQLLGEPGEETLDVDSPPVGVVEFVDDHGHPHQGRPLEARQQRELLLHGGDGGLDPVLFRRGALFEDLPGDPQGAAALVCKQVASRTVGGQGQQARDGRAARPGTDIGYPLGLRDRRIAHQQVLEDADRSHGVERKMVAQVGQAQARVVHVAEALEVPSLAGEELEELLERLALGAKGDPDLADLFLDRPQQRAGGSEGGHRTSACGEIRFDGPVQQVWPKLRGKHFCRQRNYRDGS